MDEKMAVTLLFTIDLAFKLVFFSFQLIYLTDVHNFSIFFLSGL